MVDEELGLVALRYLTIQHNLLGRFVHRVEDVGQLALAGHSSLDLRID